MKLFDSFVPRTTTTTTTTEEGLLLSYQSDSMKPSLHAVISAQIFIHLWLFVVVVDSNDHHTRSILENMKAMHLGIGYADDVEKCTQNRAIL